MHADVNTTSSRRFVRNRSERLRRNDVGAVPAAIRKSETGDLFRAARKEEGPAPIPVHPHMLRHSTGFKLANDGQDTRAIQHYLGHKNIQHTVAYTQLAADRFNGFWED